jgi:hypothetical protein
MACGSATVTVQKAVYEITVNSPFFFAAARG